MIILPTKARPENLKRFIRAYNLTCGTLPIHVIFDAKDASRYNEVETPSHWKRISVPSGTPLGGIFERVFKKYPYEPFYGMVADDVIPETAIWDVVLRDSCLPDKIAWGWDGIQNENLPVHPFIGGDLVRKLGWWAAPNLKHWFVDNVWKELSVALGNGIYLPNIKMTHHHPIIGKAPNDRTYKEQPNHALDQYQYLRFMREEFPKTVERVRGGIDV